MNQINYFCLGLTSPLIRTKYDLKCFIEKQKIKLNELNRENKQKENEDDQRLINNLTKQIDYLSSKLSQAGIFEDHLNGFKYFLADDQRLLGGGPKHSRAIDIKDFDVNKLSENSGKQGIKKVQEYLEFLTTERWYTQPGNNTCRICIINKSRYNLFYKNCGNSSGYFFSDAISAFPFYDSSKPNMKNYIPAKTGCGGILHCKITGTACGSCGYISVLVKTEGRNYTVCLGFNNPYNTGNSAGLAIRSEDGAQDEKGCIIGHGVDATGTVTEIQKFISQVKHATENASYHMFFELTRCFKITCRFQEGRWANYQFIFEDA